MPSPPIASLALYHVFKNLCSFQRFWGGKVRPDYEFRYYLLPLKANPLVTGNHNAVVYGGRATGKSWDLELIIAHAIFENPYGSIADFREREVMITATREVHVEQRCEPVYDWFISGKVPFWKEFVRVSRRRPYEIRTRLGTIFWGIPVGNDPTAKNLEGPHPWRRFIEEMGHFPKEAWEKFQNTAHERGCVDLFVGVCDGRVDMPFYSIDMGAYGKYEGSQVHLPQTLNPYWDQIKKRDRVSLLKGEDSDAYLQQVLAEHGSPVEGIWDLKTLRACMDAALPYREIVMTPTDILRAGVDLPAVTSRVRALLTEFPRPSSDFDAYFISMDPGYTHQGEIVLFGRRVASISEATPHGIWRLLGRVLLRNKVIHNHATRVLHEIAQRFPTATIGIDGTGESGKDIANTLMDRGDPRFAPYAYTARLVVYEGQKQVVTGHQINDSGEEVEMKEPVKLFATTRLRDWFGKRYFEIPYGVQDFIPAFNAETGKVSNAGNWLVETPADVHLPDVFRIFYTAWHYRLGKIDPPVTIQHVWVDPLWVNVDLLGVRL